MSGAAIPCASYDILCLEWNKRVLRLASLLSGMDLGRKRSCFREEPFKMNQSCFSLGVVVLNSCRDFLDAGDLVSQTGGWSLASEGN